LFDVLDEAGDALVAELQSRGAKARYWHVDVGNEQAVHAAIDEVAAHFGGVDVLVNNAGVAGVNKPTHEITEEEWDRVQAVNVKGVFFCTGTRCRICTKTAAAASSTCGRSTGWSVRPICRHTTPPRAPCA
jgi:NAD(P)-dependent dehydrogenase (short-subunit alcohol dehydrogenase family)